MYAKCSISTQTVREFQKGIVFKHPNRWMIFGDYRIHQALDGKTKTLTPVFALITHRGAKWSRTSSDEVSDQMW